MWIFLTYDSPAQHPRIEQAEKDYIEESQGILGVKKVMVGTTVNVGQEYSSNYPETTYIENHRFKPQLKRHILLLNYKANIVVYELPILAHHHNVHHIHY